MKKIFRFRYRKGGIPALKVSTPRPMYGEANIVVYGLSDIEDLIHESGLGLHDVFIVPMSREVAAQTRHGIWNERNLVFAYKGKRKQVCIGECNFYEDNGKGDS